MTKGILSNYQTDYFVSIETRNDDYTKFLIIKKMKTIKTIGFLVSILLSFTAIAQPWSVNPNSFQFSMTVTGEVSVSGDIINQQNAYIGAFVEGQCRGVSPSSEEGGNYKLFFITIYSNDVEGENVEFKLMDENDVETAMANTIQFKNDANYGSADSPFLWMDSEQYASTDFLSFALDSQVTTATIDAANKTISIMVRKLTDRSILVPSFTLASGAIAYISDVEQVSGVTENDYTNVVYYLVKGADGIETDWTVEVKTDNSGISEIEKNNFTIYPNPASNFIIIAGNTKQVVQVLDITGKVVLSQSSQGMKQSPTTAYFTIINNDEINIDISNLTTGIYFVKIGNNAMKLIIQK